MEIALTIIGIALVIYLLAHGVNKLSDGKSMNKQNDHLAPSDSLNKDASPNSSTQPTQELMTQVLITMNCEMHPDMNNEGWYDLEFQGGQFSVAFDDSWVRMVFPFWYTVELSDIDKLSAARRLINEMNLATRGHLLTYVVNEERNEMYIHTISHFIFTREITNLADYLKYYFCYCFTIRQDFERRLSVECANQ